MMWYCGTGGCDGTYGDDGTGTRGSVDTGNDTNYFGNDYIRGCETIGIVSCDFCRTGTGTCTGADIFSTIICTGT